MAYPADYLKGRIKRGGLSIDNQQKIQKGEFKPMRPLGPIVKEALAPLKRELKRYEKIGPKGGDQEVRKRERRVKPPAMMYVIPKRKAPPRVV